MIEYIDIGKIANTHGVRGEVKVMPLTDNPERFEKLKKVFVEKPSGLVEYSISSVKYLKNMVILKFEKVDDMTEAETLKGLILKIDRKDAIKLPKDSYFIFDLIGCEVIDEKGNRLGILNDVLQTGANDVYIVRNENGREILIPALKSVVSKISLENKIINVILPKGLLDDEV